MEQESVFFCAPLRIGALIVGWLQMVFVLMQLVGISTFISNPEELAVHLPQNIREDVLSSGVLHSMLIGILLILILDIIVLGLLLYGIYENRPGFLVPYLAFFGFQVAVEIFCVVCNLFSDRSPPIGLPPILIIGASIYFLVIIGCFRSQLSSRNQELKSSAHYKV